MFDTAAIDQLATRLSALLPPGLSAVRSEFEANAREVISAGLRRLDLVTREEFDVQRELLARTRQRVEQLEARVSELEKPPGTTN